MRNLRKVYIALSVVITAIFLIIGIAYCTKSYERLWETICGVGSSVKFYFSEIFELENNTPVDVIQPSETLQGEMVAMPTTASVFWLKFKVFFTLLNGSNLGGYFEIIGQKLEIISRFLLLLLPVAILVVIVVKKIYATPNVRHNQDTRPLRIVKKISGVTYQPIKRFIWGYKRYLDETTHWKTAWIWIWLANVNFLSIGVAFISYYFYFAVSFDIPSLYPQIVNLLKDLLLVLRYFPWLLTGTIAWIIFTRVREKIGMQVLYHHEARNCGFIKELPIVSMSCGSMGKRKTTHITDMSLSQTVMFRQEAFTRLQKQDMKFPLFPWIKFEMELRACMEYGKVYNLAST